jgi:hypothetical protein
MPLTPWIIAVVAVAFALAYLNSPGWIWILGGAAALAAGLGGALSMDAFLAFNTRPRRRRTACCCRARCVRSRRSLSMRR